VAIRCRGGQIDLPFLAALTQKHTLAALAVPQELLLSVETLVSRELASAGVKEQRRRCFFIAGLRD